MEQAIQGFGERSPRLYRLGRPQSAPLPLLSPKRPCQPVKKSVPPRLSCLSASHRLVELEGLQPKIAPKIRITGHFGCS